MALLTDNHTNNMEAYPDQESVGPEHRLVFFEAPNPASNNVEDGQEKEEQEAEKTEKQAKTPEQKEIEETVDSAEQAYKNITRMLKQNRAPNTEDLRTLENTYRVASSGKLSAEQQVALQNVLPGFVRNADDPSVKISAPDGTFYNLYPDETGKYRITRFPGEEYSGKEFVIDSSPTPEQRETEQKLQSQITESISMIMAQLKLGELPDASDLAPLTEVVQILMDDSALTDGQRMNIENILPGYLRGVSDTDAIVEGPNGEKFVVHPGGGDQWEYYRILKDRGGDLAGVFSEVVVAKP